jgi:hypothetical protein
MNDHSEHPIPDDSGEHAPPPSFWRSRAGIYLIVALVLGGLLLGYEHRAHIFAGDWILWLPLLICLGMHFFMHGGHGGHGGHGSGGDRR